MPMEVEMVLRLLLAAALGAAVGWERLHAGKLAGVRTHILVSVGAALFTVASIYGFGSADAARVAAGVVAGIGFLGAGAIIRTGEGHMAGLTTAAGIWAVAAIGLAAGAGMYAVATAAAIIALIALATPKKFGGK